MVTYTAVFAAVSLNVFNFLSRSVIGRAEQQGSLVNMFGRKRIFPNIGINNCLPARIQAQRQAFNFVIQGRLKVENIKKVHIGLIYVDEHSNLQRSLCA